MGSKKWSLDIRMQLQLGSEFRALVFLRNFGCVGLAGGCSRILRGRLAFGRVNTFVVMVIDEVSCNNP